jgi:hypothetical protein
MHRCCHSERSEESQAPKGHNIYSPGHHRPGKWIIFPSPRPKGRDNNPDVALEAEENEFDSIIATYQIVPEEFQCNIGVNYLNSAALILFP